MTYFRSAAVRLSVLGQLVLAWAAAPAVASDAQAAADPAAVPAAAAPTAATAPTAAPTAAPAPAAATATTAGPTRAPAAERAVACRPGVEGVDLTGPKTRWRISPCQGGVESVRLLDAQFRVQARHVPPGAPKWAHDRFAAGPLELVETWDAKWDPFRDFFDDAQVAGLQLGVRQGATVDAVPLVNLATYARIDPIWGVLQRSPTEVVLAWPDPARVRSPLYLVKRYGTLGTDRPYSLRVELTVWNLGRAPAQVRLGQEITSFQDPTAGGGDWLSAFAGLPDNKNAAFSLGGERTQLDVNELPEADPEDRNRVALPDWFAVGSRYFLLAAAPVQGYGQQNDLSLSAVGNGVVMARLRGPGEALAGATDACVPSWYARHWQGPSCRQDLDLLGLALAEDAPLPADVLDQALLAARTKGVDAAQAGAAANRLRARSLKTWTYEAYTGPKEMDHLRPAGHALDEAVDFGWFWFLARPMLAVLKFAHGVTGNWPLAIVILTLLVKLLLWPITHKSMASMRRMQKLKPEMDKLRAELEAKAKKQGKDKADPQELNRLTFELYKKHDVNPVGGCLPMLLQMPVYIALYRTIMGAVDLYNRPLFLWITDMTHPDPYYVLPAVLGVVMFAQQKLTPQTSGDPMQQKMMLYFMPALFTLMMLQLPAGLTLYILANTLLSIVQTIVINRSDRPAAAAA